MPTPQLPTIPEYITVHLGRPNQDAPNVQVSFSDYIKSVASSEIYPTWPESAIRANIYAQISFALNRLYSEWYRSRGYNFDITNSTQFDQSYQHQREIFDNISQLVDEIFNDYIVRQGSVAPLAARFCDGRQVNCDGLSQWGSVDLANRGYGPYDILTYYYGDDIDLVTNAPVAQVPESYPGTPLRLGDSGNNVRTIKLQLNRIARNFPSIPIITTTDTVFGPQTEAAVREFQRVFNLQQDGVVGKGTWYKIKEIYGGVTQLAELASEGITLADATPPLPLQTISRGDAGIGVQAVQYYVSAIGYFNNAVPIVEVDGIYGADTENAIRQFQQQYGLPVTGEVDAQTWAELQQIYSAILESLPEDFFGRRFPIYPGYVLNRGLENEDVRLVQQALSLLRSVYPAIPAVEATGYFGDQTYNAVRAFQQVFGIPVTGTVGPATWARLAIEYDEYLGLR